jgi:hypothetical protein
MDSSNFIAAENKNTGNKELVSGCGLYCGACGIYLATQENDIEKILQYAVVLNQSCEETLCDGCGASRKSLHCARMCLFIDCKNRKGVNFCVDCDEFPCHSIRVFQSKMPHRTEIFTSQNRMKEIGMEKWLIEMNNHFSCLACKAVNSAYHIACRKCGNVPGCEFVLQHKEMIAQYLSE